MTRAVHIEFLIAAGRVRLVLVFVAFFDQLLHRLAAGTRRMKHQNLVAFLLENAKRGEDRVIGENGLSREGRGDFSDSDCAFVPHDIHESEFGFGEVEGLFSRHERLQQLRN